MLTTEGLRLGSLGYRSWKAPAVEILDLLSYKASIPVHAFWKGGVFKDFGPKKAARGLDFHSAKRPEWSPKLLFGPKRALQAGKEHSLQTAGWSSGNGIFLQIHWKMLVIGYDLSHTPRFRVYHIFQHLSTNQTKPENYQKKQPNKLTNKAEPHHIPNPPALESAHVLWHRQTNRPFLWCSGASRQRASRFAFCQTGCCTGMNHLIQLKHNTKTRICGTPCPPPQKKKTPTEKKDPGYRISRRYLVVSARKSHG